MAQSAAAAVAEALVSVLRTGDTDAVLAVSGGSTAKLVLPRLAAAPMVPWTRIVVTLVDERWVPTTHPASNEALIGSLLTGAASSAARSGLYTGHVKPEEALDELSARTPLPDVVLLGMGADGHIASLFPGDPANHAHGRIAVASKPDFPRITLTPEALRAAKHIVLAFAGADKLAVFDRAMNQGLVEDLPVRHVFSAKTQVFASS